MNILVTGSTGFVGHNLVPKLSAHHNIYIVTTNPEKSKILFGNSVQIFNYKKNQRELINFISKAKPEVIVHLASYITSSDEFNDARKLIDVNINFLVSILDAIKSYPPKLFVNTGTFAEYFNNNEELDPAYLYAATKTASRYFIKYYANSYNYKFVNMVLYSVYGKNDSQKKLIDYLIESSKKSVNFTAGDQILDFIHVDDVVNAFLTVIENVDQIDSDSTIYVGTGTGTNVRKLALLVEKKLGRKLQINWGAIPYRKRDVMIAIAPVNKNKIHVDINVNLNDYFVHD